MIEYEDLGLKKQTRNFSGSELKQLVINYKKINN
jgi:hypothetical protein